MYQKLLLVSSGIIATLLASCGELSVGVPGLGGGSPVESTRPGPAVQAPGSESGPVASTVPSPRVKEHIWIGYSINSAGTRVPGAWRNKKWIAFTLPPGRSSGFPVRAEIRGVDLLVSGYVQSTGGTYEPGIWINGDWESLPKLSETKNSLPRGLFLSSSDDYIAGESTRDSDNLRIPGYWRNREWVELARPAASGHGFAVDVLQIGTNIIVSGNVQASSGFYRAGIWQNNIWQELPANPGTSTLAGGQPDAQGGFRGCGRALNGASVQQAVIWRGTGSPEFLSGQLIDRDSSCSGVFSVGSVEYAFGYDVSMAGVARAGVWKQGAWTEFSRLEQDKLAIVRAYIVKSDQSVIWGGYARNANNVFVAGIWENNQFVTLSVLDGTRDSMVVASVPDEREIARFVGQ